MGVKIGLFSGSWGLLLLITLLVSAFAFSGAPGTAASGFQEAPVWAVSNPLPAPAIDNQGPAHCTLGPDASKPDASRLSAPAPSPARRRPREDGTIVVACNGQRLG